MRKVYSYNLGNLKSVKSSDGLPTKKAARFGQLLHFNKSGLVPVAISI